MSTAHLSCAPADVDASLQEAEQLCRRKGGRMTPLRRQVLKLLLEAAGPSKAYDLLDKLDKEGAAKPPSVYRSLDFLLEMGLAHRIESLNAFVPCGHWGHGHAAVFLICLKCGSAGELHPDASLAALTREIEGVGFESERMMIEVRGVCAECRAKRAARGRA